MIITITIGAYNNCRGKGPVSPSGTIGGSGTGLRFGDPASSIYYRWLALRWTGSNLSSTYKIRVQVRPQDTWGSGDTGYVNPADGSAGWYEITSNSGRVPLSSSFANTKTLEIRLELIGGNDTPILHDITLEAGASDTIVLDTTPPSDITGLSGYSDNTKATSLTSGNWYSHTNPYFEWNPATDPDPSSGFAGYKYYFGQDPGGTPTTITTATSYNQTDNLTTEGTYYFKVVAYDNAGNESQVPAQFQYDFDITIYDDEDDSWVEGISGGALSFDGEDDYGAIDGLYYNIAGQIKALTVSAWVKLPPDDPNRGNWSIVDFDRSEYFSCIAGIPKTSYHGHGDYVGFHTTDQREKTHYMWSDAKIADGNWHHIVWVFDSTEQHDKKIYIDGKLDASTNGHGGNNLGYGDDVRYGFVGDGSEAYNFNGSRNEIYFKGTIDEVRIYHRALDKKEIEKLYSLYLQ